MDNIEQNFMGDVLSNDLESKKDKNPLQVLEELFTTKDIHSKTELNVKEIIEINKKRVIASLLEWDNLNFALDDYMKLKISKDRKGRAEFVDAFKGEITREQKNTNSFFSNLKNNMGFNQQ